MWMVTVIQTPMTVEEIVRVLTRFEDLPKRWPHGHLLYDATAYPTLGPTWKWSDDAGCYTEYKGAHEVPGGYCLGDRMVYAHYGRDSYGVLWRGSSSDNWGGYDFGIDLKAAIEWVRETEWSALGAWLWSRDR